MKVFRISIAALVFAAFAILAYTQTRPAANSRRLPTGQPLLQRTLRSSTRQLSATTKRASGE